MNLTAALPTASPPSAILAWFIDDLCPLAEMPVPAAAHASFIESIDAPSSFGPGIAKNWSGVRGLGTSTLRLTVTRAPPAAYVNSIRKIYLTKKGRRSKTRSPANK